MTVWEIETRTWDDETIRMIIKQVEHIEKPPLAAGGIPMPADSNWSS